MWIGISLGDSTGIGPEVTLKALAAETPTGDTRFLVIGDAGYLRRLNERLALNLPWHEYSGPSAPGRFFYHSPLSEPLPGDLTAGSPAAARAAVAWLRDGAERCLR